MPDDHSPHDTLSLGILPTLLGYQIRRANLRVVGGFAERIAQHGLTAAQFGLLVLVGANPGATQTALGRAFASNRSVMVRLIDKLEAAGLVVREAHSDDRRSNAISLTEAGRALLTTLESEVRVHEDAATSRLSRDECATLLRLLEKLNAG